MRVLWVLVLCVCFFNISFANTTYTPEQLRRMVEAGNYPKQGESTSQSKTATFKQCKATTENVMSQIRNNYPVLIIVDTEVLYTEKAWTNDAAMTVSCSKLDKKMVITQSFYQ